MCCCALTPPSNSSALNNAHANIIVRQRLLCVVGFVAEGGGSSSGVVRCSIYTRCGGVRSQHLPSLLASMSAADDEANNKATGESADESGL